MVKQKNTKYLHTNVLIHTLIKLLVLFILELLTSAFCLRRVSSLDEMLGLVACK